MKSIYRWNSKTAKKEYLEALISDEKKEAIPYDKGQSHNLGDYIDHPKFGFGFIQKIINHTKIGVFFEDSEKVMLQNWRQV